MEVFCPAKVNLLLGVTGRRPDGHHNLVSLMAPLDFGDTLHIEAGEEGERSFGCSDSSLPMDENNLVVLAARLFERVRPVPGGYRIHLTKRIPMGAGLGGGSSDAAGALRLLDCWNGNVCPRAELIEMAGELGADCPFFLENRPMVARGKGERLSRLPDEADKRLRAAELLLVKPSFSVATAWAFRRMVERGNDYVPADEVERRLGRWLDSSETLEGLFFNNMEPAVFEKYIALPVFAERLKQQGVPAVMSGSGSTLLAAVSGSAFARRAEDMARECLGESVWRLRARCAW